MNVYGLGQEFDLLSTLIEEEVIDEQALMDAWETLIGDTQDKFEGCCKYLVNVKTTIGGLDDEIKRLQAKKKSLENASKRLKDLMYQTQKKSGEDKLQCGTFKVWIQKNPESVVMDEPYIENIPEEYLRYKEPEVDKKKLLEHLKAGVAPEGIAHIEQTEGIRFR